MTPVDSTELQTDLQLAVAAGAAVAPLIGPDAVLADQVLSQGLAYWAAYQAKKAAGTLTLWDVQQAAVKTNFDLQQLAADVHAQADADLRASGG